MAGEQAKKGKKPIYSKLERPMVYCLLKQSWAFLEHTFDNSVEVLLWCHQKALTDSARVLSNPDTSLGICKQVERRNWVTNARIYGCVSAFSRCWLQQIAYVRYPNLAFHGRNKHWTQLEVETPNAKLENIQLWIKEKSNICRNYPTNLLPRHIIERHLWKFPEGSRENI